MQAVLTNPRTVLKALELCARLNSTSSLKRPGTQGRVASGFGNTRGEGV
jgi:hypothetical protein